MWSAPFLTTISPTPPASTTTMTPAGSPTPTPDALDSKKNLTLTDRIIAIIDGLAPNPE